MRYRCMASAEVVARCRTADGAVSPHQLLAVPAVIFNRKDALQDTFLAQHFGLRQPHYPRHFAPATDAFETALALGLGWGMVPEQHLKARPTLHEVLPGATVDVALYWQHWAHEPSSAQRLTEAVKTAAQAALAPLPVPSAAPTPRTPRARQRSRAQPAA